MDGELERYYLSLGELVQVLERFRLVNGTVSISNRAGLDRTYVLQDGLHERDGDLGLLNEVVLRVLDFEAGVFLLGRACVLQATKSNIKYQ